MQIAIRLESASSIAKAAPMPKGCVSMTLTVLVVEPVVLIALADRMMMRSAVPTPTAPEALALVGSTSTEQTGRRTLRT